MHDRLSPELQQRVLKPMNKSSELILRSANDLLYCITQMETIPRKITFDLRRNWTNNRMDKYPIGSDRKALVGVEIARKFGKIFFLFLKIFLLHIYVSYQYIMINFFLLFFFKFKKLT